jgi:hypothetical protein
MMEEGPKNNNVSMARVVFFGPTHLVHRGVTKAIAVVHRAKVIGWVHFRAMLFELLGDGRPVEGIVAQVAPQAPMARGAPVLDELLAVHGLAGIGARETLHMAHRFGLAIYLYLYILKKIIKK